LGSRVAFKGNEGASRVIHVHGGGSYLSQSPTELLVSADIGLDSIEVRWPDGSLESFSGQIGESGEILLQAGNGQANRQANGKGDAAQ
jgi:ASPIC and UnbV